MEEYMVATNRRSALKYLLSVPWVASLSSHTVENVASDTLGCVAEAEHRRLGIQIMRLINTAQRRFYGDACEYADMQRLSSSAALQRMRTSLRMSSVGLGEAFINGLALTAEEIAPMWKLRLMLSADAHHYLAVLASLAVPRAETLLSDQDGTIYSTSALDVQAGEAAVAAKDIVGAVALQGRPRSAAGRLAKSAMFLGSLTGVAPADFCFTCLTCCACVETCCFRDCTCHCQPQWDPGLECSNCGCQSCTWSCCP
jgi:hypothetical protein